MTTSSAEPPAEPPAESPAAEGEGVSTAPPRPRRRWLPRRRAGAAPDQAPAPTGDATGGGEPPPAPATAGDAPEPPATAEVGEETPPPPTEGGSRRLRRNRRRLISRREEAVYHLGGLAFELYRRDMLTEEVMRRRAGEVAQIDDSVRDIDVRLGELDRERRERRRGAPADASAGCCLTCRSTFRAEARFCWQCGAQLVPPSVGDEQVTAVISGPAP